MMHLKNIIAFLFIAVFIQSGHGQDSVAGKRMAYLPDEDSHIIKVYFLYGSRPALGHLKTEKFWFGGIHGGHVSIGYDSVIVGFKFKRPFHVVAHRKHITGRYDCQALKNFVKDTVSMKYTVFELKLSDEQFRKLKEAAQRYLEKPPYDYAFIGMRCASSAYDLLSIAGLFEKRSRMSNIVSNFYPRLLRNKMFILSREREIRITRQEGRKTRVWESDRADFRRIP